MIKKIDIDLCGLNFEKDYIDIEHGKAIVLEGKVSRVAILSDHHGGCQDWHLITFKSLE